MVTFQNSTIRSAHFSMATFEQTRFHGVTFVSRPYFEGARFHEHADFENVHFANGANFRRAAFARSCKFDQSSMGTSIFREAFFAGKVSFSQAAFKGVAHFQGCDISEPDWCTLFPNGEGGGICQGCKSPCGSIRCLRLFSCASCYRPPYRCPFDLPAHHFLSSPKVRARRYIS
ncbi:pentapeptide repeat-containing protein [Streptomyces sp. NPDC044780]|uniref:pentapeptide repeat-containing protein n=1 Tax=unclassified Streptomyces TaxID=2593676 RepID=UPI0033D2BBE6